MVFWLCCLIGILILIIFILIIKICLLKKSADEIADAFADRVASDTNALSRIFGNIINNAVKYSDGDLIITLSEDGEITFANHASQLDGIKVGRLFDRFYTVETASAESTGLGLSIAKALIEQMGGKIAAEYEDGIIRVKVIFPLL